MLTALLTASVLATASARPDGMRLTRWHGEARPEWLTEEQILAKRELVGKWPRFVDLTDARSFNASAIRAAASPIPTSPSHTDTIKREYVAFMDEPNVIATIGKLESYNTRYYTTQDGFDAAEWIAQQFETIAAGNPKIQVQLFEHTWLQPSVVVQWQGEGPNADEAVVLGAHLDSVAGLPTSRAPGADDDASGIAALLEAFRVLVSGGFTPGRTVYFLGFAAEEVGLRGSQAIAQSFSAEGKELMCMLQMEMNGWAGSSKQDNQFTILNDAVNDNDANALLRNLAGEYLPTSYKQQTSSCGYGCSDHYSFSNQGYRVACIAEDGPGGANPFMHSSSDTMDKIDTEQTLNFAKVACAFVVELSLAPGGKASH